GVDGRSLTRVIIKTILLGNRSSGGGSTITQQLAKNLFGRKDFGSLSLPINKIREAILAVRLEEVFSKEEILSLYLNSVPFGEEVFGIEAASNRYFNKHVAELTVDESALLIGVLKGNTYYHPRLHPDRALDRRNLILDLMNQQEKLSDAMARSLKEKPLNLDYSNFSIDGPAQYFLYQVENKARIILSHLKKENGDHYDMEKDGLKIETTLDSRLQELAVDAIKNHLKTMQPLLDKDPALSAEKRKFQQTHDQEEKNLKEIWTWDGVKVESMSEFDSIWHYKKMLNAGMLILEPETGNIRVWIGGNHFRYLPYDLVLADRMIASAFKPVIFATALEEGWEPCDYFDNEIKTYEKYDDWTPRNYDGTSGDEVAMWYALARSLNLPTIDLFFKLGFNRVEEMCFRLGINNMPENSPSIALGAIDLSLRDMVPVYATFANGGRKPEPRMIERILDATGRVIYENEASENQYVLDPEISQMLTSMLQKAVNEGTGAALRARFNVSSDLAGKTGTSQNYSDAWFFTYNPGMVCGIWVGAFDPQIHFTSGNNGSGSSLALPIAGYLIRDIETDPSLKNAYLRNFSIPGAYLARMACEPTRTKGGLNRFFESIFGKKNKKDSIPQEGSKFKQFFKGIFKKKKK
ncbi:MAG: transglycosylase domain-containing protein, partial [Cyclobacteriaceae bacterium]|nr:transglycosylase domain-containing protein [Cyclobacteriaceae bacterium]